MSYPILYSATEINFDHNGLGILSDCASCEVTEEANGIFELAMTYPMDGVHFSEIGDRAIIRAKADQFREPQLFRVYAISKPMNGIVTVLAEHISYDLSGIPVKPFAADNAILALAGLKNNAVVDCPFDFWTDKATQANFKVSFPSSIRSRLGGVQGSILDAYGGEYEFDNYTVKLHNNRGMNRGVSIRYGKNLTDFQQEQNCSRVATGVYPYWVDSDGGSLLELPEKIINAPGTYNFVKISTLDLSSEFESQPTVQQLRERAEKYVASNNIGVPTVSMSVSFVQLEQTEEYKHLNLLERVGLFDTVNVEFPQLNVSATAKAVKIVYDVILDRVKSVSLGSVRANIADTIAEHQKDIEQSPTKAELRRATEWLTNGKGYKVERRDSEGNAIDTLYLDTPDIATAKNVMRVGQSGIGFSRDGVDGPYYSAWTIDGRFNADFISGGVLSSPNGSVKIDMSGEKEPVFNTGISANGFTLRGDRINAPRLMRVAADMVDSRDSVNILFFTSDGRGIAGISHVFDGGEQVGLQYRAYNSNIDGDRKNGIDIRTGGTVGNSYGGYYLIKTVDFQDVVVGYLEVFGDDNPVSVLSVDRIIMDGKNAYWSQQSDGTYIMKARD